MADVKWIKIVTDIFDDEKIQIIDSMPDKDAIIVIWFKLLCLAGKQNNSGVFMISDCVPYTEEMFAAVFRRPLNTVRMALEIFEKLQMVKVVDNVVTIPNWGKHQNLEQIAARNEYMRKYMQDYRAKQQRLISGEPQEQQPVNVNVSTNVNANNANSKQEVSSPEEDIDRDKDIEGDLERDIKNTTCAEMPDAGHSTPKAKPDPAPSDFEIPLNDGSMYNVPLDDVDVYRKLYPNVDVDQALRNMIGWTMSNPKNRKTRNGIKRFITGWLSREQNRGGTRKPADAQPKPAAQDYQQHQYTDEDFKWNDLERLYGGK